MQKINGDGKGKIINITAPVDRRCSNVSGHGIRCSNQAEAGEKYCWFCLQLKELQGDIGGKKPASPTK